jgi:hypothetical protein
MTVNSVLDEAPVQTPPTGNPEPPLETVPSYIEVGYWRDEEGGWSGHAQLLGVSATADSEGDLFSEMVDQVEEFWQILNDRFPTLSEELKYVLKLRGLPLRFEKQAEA